MGSVAAWPEAASLELETSAPPLRSALASGLPWQGVGGVGRGGFYIPDSFQTGEWRGAGDLSVFQWRDGLLDRGGTIPVA